MNTEMKTTQTELYNRFKSTTTKSIIHLTEHIFYFSLFLYFLIFAKNNYIMKHEPFLFDDVNYLSIVDCLNNCWLALYDEDTKQYTDLYF